jgi:hypothetical protein
MINFTEPIFAFVGLPSVVVAIWLIKFIINVQKAMVGILRYAQDGEMPEWSIGLAWKASELARVPGVRIPLSPP